MRIVKYYSHLNGLEFLQAKKPRVWKEINSIISLVKAEDYKTKISKEKTMKGKSLYAPKKLNKALGAQFKKRGWQERRVTYWVSDDEEINRKILQLSPEEQKAAIEKASHVPFLSFNQTDFVKDRIAVEVQLGKYSFVAYDLFVKHLTFYSGNVIDLGIEIVPMKEMQANMSSGPPYYERELFHLLRQGRNNPPVPLILVGIAP